MNNKLKNLKLEDNFKGTFAEYVNQKVPHPTSPNQEITLETDYQLFLASKKRKPNGFDSNLKKYLSLEWIKIKDLYFDGTINVRNRVFHIKDRNKTYELASKYRPSALDALHVVRIEGKNYVDDGQKRSAGSLLRFGNPEMLVPCLVDITLEDLPEKEIERKRRSGFVTINMERDQLDKFTQYASRYADGDAMATAIFNITIPTHCAVNPNTEDRPIFKALGTIEKIIKGKYTGDSIDVLDKHLKRVRGPKVSVPGSMRGGPPQRTGTKTKASMMGIDGASSTPKKNNAKTGLGSKTMSTKTSDKIKGTNISRTALQKRRARRKMMGST